MVATLVPRPATSRLLMTCLVAAASTTSATGRAEDAHPRTSSLSWVRMPGAESCIATQDLAKRVEARLGRAVFVSAAEADVSVEGRIEPSRGHGYRAVLMLRDAHGATLGTRELARDDASCEAIRDPLALVIALMIDPDAGAGAHPAPPAPSPPAPTPEPVTVVVEKPVYIPVAAAPEPRRASWALDAGASFATTFGLLPNAGFGASVNALLTPPHFIPLEGFGTAWFEDRGVSLLEVGGGLCPLHHAGPRLHLDACALGEIGGLTAHTTQSTTVFLGFAIEGRASIRLAGPFALRAGLSAVVPILRPSVGTGGFRESAVAGVADVGVGVLFP